MFKLFVSTVLMSLLGWSQAATFCVDNSDDLQFVLNLAGSNNQDDTIKIEAGNYLSDNPGSYAFEFENLDGDYDLNISGGWISAFSNCDAQPSGNSQTTLLDGENTTTPLFLKVYGTAANITIDNITFINGLADINGRGGGLNIFTADGYSGIITITRNQFIANQAEYGSALSLARGSRINVKNNLFVANQALSAHTIEIVQNDAIGVYFTNNTVVNNTSSGLRVSVGGSSQVMVANNLFWANDILDLQLVGGGLRYFYHNNYETIFNTPDFEAGNFSAEPVFASGGFLEFTPALSSAMINRGYMPFPFPLPTPFCRNWSLGTTDVMGNNRVQDNGVDIGAFEAPAEVPIFADGFE